MNALLLSLQRAGKIPLQLYKHLRSSAGKIPLLYGLPKIHKPDIPGTTQTYRFICQLTNLPGLQTPCISAFPSIYIGIHTTMSSLYSTFHHFFRK